jgi:hypothetical protein
MLMMMMMMMMTKLPQMMKKVLHQNEKRVEKIFEKFSLIKN